MDILQFLPEDLRDALPNGAWYGILAFAAFALLMLLFGLLSFIRRLFRREPTHPAPHLQERFADYPPVKPSSADVRLEIERVPVRLRLVVIAPAGKESDVDMNKLDALLDRVVPDLSKVVAADKPRVRRWPMQLSYEGFANHFHKNAIIPEGEHQPSKWIVVAGRAKLADCQVMVGLGLEAGRPVPLGHMTLDSHEWPVALKVRTRAQ
jgi:hypothetical protein